MMELFNLVLYKPLLNLLVVFYNFIPDIGVSIILLTILIRLLLWPLNAAMYKGQKALQTLQPQLKKLQEQHKNNKEELSKALMALYKEHKVNPLSSCLPVLAQIPLLIALYQVLSDGLNAAKALPPLYSFVANPEHFSLLFLGLIDLSQPSIPMA